MAIARVPEVGPEVGNQARIIDENGVGLAPFAPHPEMLLIPAQIQVFDL